MAVLHDTDGVFALDHVAALKSPGLGGALSHDGSLLVVTGEKVTSLLDVARLRQGPGDPQLAVLSGFSLSVYAAISPDDRLLFVSDEEASRVSVFDLAKARAGAHDALLGRIPVATAPVGMAFSPDGRWLYVASEFGPPALGRPCRPELARGPQQPRPAGALTRVEVAKAATDPAHAVVGALPAGCSAVRVAVAPPGSTVWVTARGEGALLRFQVAGWLAGSGPATVQRFAAGTSPVGLAVRPGADEVWVALSARFGKSGAGQLARFTDAGGTSAPKIQTMPSAGFPQEVSFLPDGQTAVATLFDAGQVELVPVPGSN